MPSLKSQIFNCILRNRHFFQFKLKKEVFDFNTSIIAFREQCEKSAARLAKLPDGIKTKPEIIDGIRAEWIIPDGADANKVILYVHGGGYVSGSCDDHRAIVAKFAKRCGFTNLLFDYRLAPEFPFPAAVDDTISVYNFLLTKYKPENILIAGESAGGGLCLAALLALKDKSLPMPCGAVAMSPWTDLKCTGESYKTKNKVSLAPKDSWIVFSKYYAGDCDAAMPLISPLYGDLKGLPPIFINSGTDDELFDDGKLFYEKALKSGVDIKFRAGERMVHCYPLLAPFFPEATMAMDEIANFIKLRLR